MWRSPSGVTVDRNPDWVTETYQALEVAVALRGDRGSQPRVQDTGDHRYRRGGRPPG